MIDDPIVNEIRQIRRAYAEALNYDLHAICDDLRRQERLSGRKFRTPSRGGTDPACQPAKERTAAQ